MCIRRTKRRPCISSEKMVPLRLAVLRLIISMSGTLQMKQKKMAKIKA